MASTPEIENYPALKKMEGFQLSMDMESHARDLGAEIEYAEITDFDLHSPAVICGAERIEARALILSMGASRRKLGCEGEDKFAGRGVSYCAVCDGNFFREKSVMVVGGGNTALEDALYMANLGCKVYLVHRRTEFRGGKALEERVRAESNIELMLERIPLSINGEVKVESVTVKHTVTGRTEDIEVSGVFVAVGVVPATELLKGMVPLTQSGHIDSGEDCKTPFAGVFCAGDIRVKPLYQIVTACADGAVAATAAAEYVMSGE
jgi:thioredoxin reductase (NADPH)